MNIPLDPKVFRLESPVGENALKAVVEGTLNLPAGYPLIQRVVRVAAVPRVDHWEAADGEVSLEGTLDVTLLYAAPGEEAAGWRPLDDFDEEEPGDYFDDAGEFALDEQLYRVLWRREMPFHGVVAVSGAHEGSGVTAHVEVDEIRAAVAGGGRSVEVDAVLSASVRVVEPRHVEVPAYAGGGGELEGRLGRESLVVRNRLLRVRDEASIQGRLYLPAEAAPVRRPLDVNVVANVEAIAFDDGWAQVSGTLDTQLAYVPEGATAGPVEFAAWEGQLSFTHRFQEEALHGRHKGTVTPRVLSVDAETIEDGRGIEIFADVELTLSVGGDEPAELITGVEAPSADVAVETRSEPLTLEVKVAEGEQVRSVTGVVEVPEGLPPIERLLAHEARAAATDVLVLGDRVSVAGHVDVSLLYVARAGSGEGQVQFAEWKGALPFEAEVPVGGVHPPMRAHVRVQVDEMDPDLLNRETVEWKGRVRITAEVEDTRTVDAVVEAVVVEPEEENPPSYTFLVVHPGDTLWKVSRRYHTTPEAIVALNPHLEEGAAPLAAGSKICIPRHRPRALVPLNGAARGNGG